MYLDHIHLYSLLPAFPRTTQHSPLPNFMSPLLFFFFF